MAAPPADEPPGLVETFRRVRWSISFAALCAYTFTVVTQRLEIGTAAIAIGLAGVLFERGRLRVAPFLGPLALFILWGLMASKGSYWPEETSRMLGVISRIAIIAFLVAAVVNDGLRLRAYAYVFVFSFMIYPVRGALLNYFVVGHTLYGRAIWNHMYENPNDLAALTLFPLALTTWLATTSRGRERLALMGVAGLQLLTLLLTQSRGALVGLVLGGLMFFLTRSHGRRGRTLLTTACLAVLVIPFVPDSAWERFSGMSNLTSRQTIRDADPEGSAEARYNIWKVARRIISEHPVTGVGFGAYEAAHLRYGRTMDIPRTARGARDTHSTYLNVAAETGLVGLALFLLMVAIAVAEAEAARRARPRTPASELVLLAELGFLAFMAAGVFGSFAHLNFLYLQLAVITGAALWARQQPAASVALAGARSRVLQPAAARR